jgi:oligosaccharide repeat unit polymerase
MAFGKCLALVFSLMILGQAYLVRRRVGTWLFPACLFGLFWFGFTFVPLVVLLTVPIDPWGTGSILLCLMSFSFTAFLFPWSEAFKKNALKRQATPHVYESPFLRKVFYALSSVTLVCIVLDSLAQGISIHDLLYDLIATAAWYRNLDSFDGLGLNITLYNRFSEILIYDVAMLGGMLVSSTPTKWGRFRIIMFSFIPGVLLAVAHSTKWNLFACIASFYGGLLTHRVRQSNFCLFEKGVFKKAVLCIAILVPITAASFMSRGLQNSEDSSFVRDKLVSMFASYSCGHLYAFSDWHRSYMAEHWGFAKHSSMSYSREHTTYGMYTFTPLFRFFGGTKVLPTDASDDYYEYGDLLTTNISTIFRGLIQDFGLSGSLLFMFLMGFLIHWSFCAMLMNRKPVFTVTVFMFSIAFFYASFARSIFDWSSLYFTFVLMWAILAFNKWITQREGSQLAMATEVTARQ